MWWESRRGWSNRGCKSSICAIASHTKSYPSVNGMAPCQDRLDGVGPLQLTCGGVVGHSCGLTPESIKQGSASMRVFVA